MSRVAQQEAPAVAQGRNDALVHLEVRSPPQIGETDVGSNPGVEQRCEIGGGRRPVVLVGLLAIDEDEETAFGKRRKQHETARPNDNARPSGRSRKRQSHVRNDETPAIGFAVETLLHGVTR